MTTAKTKDITNNLRKDAVVSALVPPTLCQSQPVPLLKNGVPCLGYYFYGIVGRDDQHSLLSIPLYRVVINKQTGRVIEAISGLSFLPPNTDIKKPVARFPGKGLAGKNIEEQNALLYSYYNLCDSLLDDCKSGQIDQSSVYPKWKSAFDTIMEEGLEQWYMDLLNSNAPQSNGSFKSSQNQNDALIFKSTSPKALPQSNLAAKKIQLPIEHFLIRVDELLANAKCDNLQKQLETVRQMRIRNDFRIAVIGEFSRGKSYFLNKLLGTELLAEGALPTTALITQIENGETPSLFYIAPGQSPKKLEVTPESFERFIADDNGNDPSGVLALQLPVDWFNGHNIKLCDTPGAGDLFGKRAELTLEAIQVCDAVIMTIAAPMACSMTEMAFLHDNVVLKATPKVSILVSKLDIIRPEERSNVVEYIQSKIRTEVPDAKFWTVLEAPEISYQTAKMFDVTGIPAIRKAITEIVDDEDLLRLRSVQAVTALKDIANQAYQSLKIQLDVINDAKDKKLEKLEEVKKQQNDKTILWNRLKLNVSDAQLDTVNNMESNLKKCQSKLYEELSFQLDKTNSPKEWIEKDFQFSLRRNIEGISNALEKEILQQFAVCQQSLIKDVNQHFGVTLESVDFANYMLGANNDVQSVNGSPEMKDLGRYQQITRVVLMGATPLAFMFIGPFAALVTGGASWFAGEQIKKQVDQQKEQVRKWLYENLGRVFDQLQGILDNYIQDGYDKILKNVQSATQKWLDAQQNAYEQACENVNNDSSAEPLEKLIGESTQIINDIDHYINPKL